MNRRSAAVLACALATAPAGRAYAVDDMLTARSLAVGESLRGEAIGALGPTLNPAGMALVRGYTIEATYGFDVRSLGSNLHLSIVDSQTSRVSAGIYYNFIYATHQRGVTAGHGIPDLGDTNVVHTGNETGLALAMMLGQYFALGVTSKYLQFTTEAPNPAYTSASPAGVPRTYLLESTTRAASASGFTLDAGISLRLGERFGIGVVGYNLIPLNAYDAPLALGMGLVVKPVTSLTLAFDTVVNFDKYRVLDAAGNAVPKIEARFGGGIEWLIAGKVPLRAGSLYDTGRPGGWLTFGLGFVSKSFGLDVSYRQQITNGIESRLALGLRIFLQ